MRDDYHEELDSVGRAIVEMAELVASALARATTALLEADLALAETVICGDDAVDALARRVEACALDLIARQQPVAGDLRVVVACLRASADLERMGDLAAHVAQVARRRHPQRAIPYELRATIKAMGRIGVEVARTVARITESRDVETARQVPREDDAMDRLHRDLFAVLVSRENPCPIGCAIDVTLVGRYYERFADHAVSVAGRLIFLVTGEQEHGAHGRLPAVAYAE